MKVLKTVIVISLMMLGSSCTRDIEYITTPLPIPPRPLLERISAEEASTIPINVWMKIVRRDMARRNYAEQLEVIVQSTHKDKK